MNMTSIELEYHKRNKLLVWICWMQVALFTVLYAIMKFPLFYYIDIVSEALFVGLPLEILNRRRKLTLYIPYIFGVLFMLMLVICNLYFSYKLEIRALNPFSFLISAALMSQYPSVRPILFYGGLSLVVLNGFFLGGFELAQVSHPLFFMNYFMLMMVILLAISSKLTQRYYQSAEQLNRQTKEQRERIESLWVKIQTWGRQLQGVSTENRGEPHPRSLLQEELWSGGLPPEKLEERLAQLIAESERQMEEIQAKNKVLKQVAEQIERLAVQEERNRVARELHDQIGHTYTGMTMGLESIKYLYRQAPDQAEEKLDQLLDLMRKSFEEVRSSVHRMSEGEGEQTLSEHLRSLVEDPVADMDIRMDIYMEEPESLEPEVPAPVRHTLYRCLQEALTNAQRHGRARSIQVELHYERDRILLRIRDNGVGAENLHLGFGLRSMKERLAALQGRLHVSSRSGSGTEVVCTVPLSRQYHSKEIRLVIADDQPLVRESLSLLLSQEPDFDVAATASNGRDALELVQQHEPRIVLLDLHMPELDGVEVTRHIKATRPDIRVIILTTFEDRGRAAEAIRLGAEGYLLKTIHPSKLMDALRLVYSGGTLMSQEVARKLAMEWPIEQEGSKEPGVSAKTTMSTSIDRRMDLDKVRQEGQAIARDGGAGTASVSTSAVASATSPAAFGLNDRELAIMRLLAQGKKYKEIALAMNFSENTIRNYISAAYAKLGAENRTQAIEKVRNFGGLH